MQTKRKRNAPFIFMIIIGANLGGKVAAQDVSDLFLVGANIIDPSTQEVRRGNLLIREGVIVGAPQVAPADFSGDTMNLDKKWVIPGLVDLHVHTFGNALLTAPVPVDTPGPAGVAQRMLYAGVTSFLDLFGGAHEDQLFELRDRQRAGEIGGAEMFASLSCITAPGGHGTQVGIPARTVSTPEEARRTVENLALRHPDAIKIIYGSESSPTPVIDKDTMFAAVEAARANGLKTVVHVETWPRARDAVEAGATAITHIPDGDMPEDLARTMAASDVAVIPTLTAHTDTESFIGEPEVLDNPLARALTTSDVIEDYRSDEVLAQLETLKPQLEIMAASRFRSVRTMVDAGVTVLLGTDSGVPGTIQGYSVHRELIKLVAAGLSPWQALAAATTDAGGFLDRRYGVTPGSEANLIVLDASPLEDIRNTQKIVSIIHHGYLVDRDALLESEIAGLQR